METSPGKTTDNEVDCRFVKQARRRDMVYKLHKMYGTPVKNAWDLMKAAENKKSVVQTRWGTKPAAFLTSMQFWRIQKMIDSRMIYLYDKKLYELAIMCLQVQG